MIDQATSCVLFRKRGSRISGWASSSQETVENADESHFIVNVNSSHTLRFKGEKEVRYADVVSGGDGMTMMVHISDGRNGQLENQFMKFKNKDSNYPIRGVPDIVPGVA